MILGQKPFFTKEHFETHKGLAPAPLCELVVYCLELVSQLSHRGLSYRFKGGNSQLLLLENPERFSIDVDIVTTMSKQTLIEHVEQITKECEVFTRCEVRPHKTKPWLPMISFNIFFDSVYHDKKEAFVMLDAVFEEAPYGGVNKTVKCGELYASKETVELPSIPGLTGDKLLCIGPSTVGIPLGKNKEAQRLKHVFDVANLSRHEYDLPTFLSSVRGCLDQENQLQRSSWSMQEVVADTKQFVGEPLEHTEKPAESTLEPGTYLDEIVRGFDEFGHYLFRIDYTWNLLQNDCSRIISLLERIEG